MYMQRTAKSLSLSAKTGAFMRGLVGRGPMVEIARRGLSRDIPEDEAHLYAMKLVSSSSPAELSEMLANGDVKSGKAQALFAQSLLAMCTVSGANESFARLSEAPLCSGNVSSEEAQEMLASALMIVVTSRLENGPGASAEAFNIIKSGKVTCEKAREHLAWCIRHHGSVLQALEAYQLGSLSVTAQAHLAFKIVSEGEAVHSFEALLSGNATSNEAQKMFASAIMRQGSPAMARTALMSDMVTDPEAVIFLKQALKG
jgi:hypothetical protein